MKIALLLLIGFAFQSTFANELSHATIREAVTHVTGGQFTLTNSMTFNRPPASTDFQVVVLKPSAFGGHDDCRLQISASNLPLGWAQKDTIQIEAGTPLELDAFGAFSSTSDFVSNWSGTGLKDIWTFYAEAPGHLKIDADMNLPILLVCNLYSPDNRFAYLQGAFAGLGIAGTFNAPDYEIGILGGKKK